MSSTGTYAPSGGLAAPAAARPLVAAVILALFVLSAVLSAQRKDITQGFDEVAHTSYVAHIQHTGDAWPRLEAMRLLDPKTFQFTTEANYLNHPPLFYALLAALGPRLEGRPQALLVHRLIDVAIGALGFAVLLWLGLAARFSANEFYAYAVPLAAIPVLVPLVGAMNNDNAVFLGGAVTMLGVWQLAALSFTPEPGEGRGLWLAVALCGMVFAAFAKLTGLLLTGAMVGAALVYLFWRKQLPWNWIVPAALAFALAASPYIVFLIQYGSPTPETPAQLGLLAHGAQAAGWSELPRKSFSAYLLFFTVAFVTDWMPALGARSVLNYAMLAIPVAALLCAFAGIAVSLYRLWRRNETALDVVVISGAVALAATFAVHVTYSYGRHLSTGWLMDAYPRYYLPLAAIVPLAGLSLLAGITSSRVRAGLLMLFIAGPILFRILGAPLG